MITLVQRVAAAAMATALSFAVAVPAGATMSDAPPSDAEIREFWTEYGVTPNVQDALVNKLEVGGKLDSANAFAEPVDVSTTTHDGMNVTVETFADGSIRASGIEQATAADEQVGTLDTGVTDCTVTSGTGFVAYTGCQVFSANGTQNIQFKVNYERYRGAHAKILRSWDAKATSRFGTVTPADDLPRTLWRPESTATQKAVVKYKTDYESWNGASSETIYLAFWLASDGTRSVGRS